MEAREKKTGWGEERCVWGEREGGERGRGDGAGEMEAGGKEEAGVKEGKKEEEGRNEVKERQGEGRERKGTVAGGDRGRKRLNR